MSKLPANELLWMTVKNEQGNPFYITSDKNRTIYYIYDSEFKKLGKKANPASLEEKYVKRGII